MGAHPLAQHLVGERALRLAHLCFAADAAHQRGPRVHTEQLGRRVEGALRGRRHRGAVAVRDERDVADDVDRRGRAEDGLQFRAADAQRVERVKLLKQQRGKSKDMRNTVSKRRRRWYLPLVIDDGDINRIFL